MVSKIKDMFKPAPLKGDLEITGEGFVDVEIGAKQPISFTAHFTDFPHWVPCNPQHGHDEVKCSVKNMRYLTRGGKDFYVLRISWHVFEHRRRIEWHVFF